MFACVVGGADVSNQWQHIAVVIRDNQRTLFINGTQRRVDQLNCTGGDLSTGGLIIGGAADTQHQFTGFMHGLRLSTGALYTQNFQPPTYYGVEPNTLFMFPLNEPAGTAPRDLGPNQIAIDVLPGARMGADLNRAFCRPGIQSERT